MKKILLKFVGASIVFEADKISSKQIAENAVKMASDN
jgi:hypothetical protein